MTTWTVNSAFFADLLSNIADRGRVLLGRGDLAIGAQAVSDACEDLLSGRGEASGTAIAREVLDGYARLDALGRAQFFEALADRFGPDHAALVKAIEDWRADPTSERTAELHFASEPRRQSLFRRLNRAPGGIAALVAMRADLIALGRTAPALKIVDRDLAHLLGSWFNRGFLVLRRIDWSTPALVLEKIIRYEAVHEISDWDELRRRIDPSDRRCYAFFHPALVDEPLIFVEVALTEGIPDAIGPLLAGDRRPTPIERARTAVFYSISNCQKGLAGISFGNFLIKQVVEELRREMPKLETFVTLSPAPDFMRWAARDADAPLSAEERALVAQAAEPGWAADAERAAQIRRVLQPLAAYYFLRAKGPGGKPTDSVARFHLGNGARLERINQLGDRSAKAMRESAGLMVNYLYDLDDIERNHEAFANLGDIAASSAVRKLLKQDKTWQRLATNAAALTGQT